jgi:hypothetical protein
LSPTQRDVLINYTTPHAPAHPGPLLTVCDLRCTKRPWWLAENGAASAGPRSSVSPVIAVRRLIPGTVSPLARSMSRCRSRRSCASADSPSSAKALAERDVRALSCCRSCSCVTLCTRAATAIAAGICTVRHKGVRSAGLALSQLGDAAAACPLSACRCAACKMPAAYQTPTDTHTHLRQPSQPPPPAHTHLFAEVHLQLLQCRAAVHNPRHITILQSVPIRPVGVHH